ncbi:hypothetical protein BH11PLA2_BH11PLA2_20230 [soil metagenome]
MTADRDKRKLRELKRAVKKRGAKHRRAELKRVLGENPEEAAFAVENFGRHSSALFNGLDRDSTRQV